MCDLASFRTNVPLLKIIFPYFCFRISHDEDDVVLERYVKLTDEMICMRCRGSTNGYNFTTFCFEMYNRRLA